MIKVVSTVPLYIGGQVVTEFQTTDTHLRDLQRVHGTAKVHAADDAPDKSAPKAEAKKATKQ